MQPYVSGCIPPQSRCIISIHVSAFQIAKFVDDQCLVFGYANVSVAKSTAAGQGGHEIFDLQNDSIPPEELEKAAYKFMLDFRESDENHSGPAIGQCIESMVFTPEKLEKLCTDPVSGVVYQEALLVLKQVLPPRWWVGFKLNKESYQAVKSGQYKMFSIAGEADRVEV